MNDVLERLGIDPSQTIYALREQLEDKQIEYMSKLNVLQSKKIFEASDIKIQMEKDVDDIEKLLGIINWSIKRLEMGISVEKTETTDQSASYNDERLINIDSHNSDDMMDIEYLCNKAIDYMERIDKKYEKAFDLFSKAAQMGSTKAKSGLAHMYMYGYGVEEDEKKAYAMSLETAKLGDAFGQCNLGEMYYYGISVEEDKSKAADWYWKSAVQGFARAQARLGNMYLIGAGLNKDLKEAKKWIDLAVEQEDAEGECYLGCMYVEPDEDDQNEYKDIVIPSNAMAKKLFGKAAEKGVDSAQYNLGVVYAMEEDYKTAAKWLKLAAEQGCSEAQCTLGQLFCYEQSGLQDYEEAVKWLAKAADQDDVEAQCYLAEMYYSGTQITRNYEEAFRLYHEAAMLGDMSAQYNLAEMYYSGTGVEKNYEKALNWLWGPAHTGNTLAQTKMAEMMYKGEGGERSYTEALKWFKKAADNGDAKARYRLSVMYYRGEGVKVNYAVAADLCLKAAEQGLADAQYLLAGFYELGLGVREDTIEAIKWYKKSAEQGVVKAFYKLAKIYSNLNDDIKNLKDAYRYYRKAGPSSEGDLQTFLSRIADTDRIDHFVLIKQIAEDENDFYGYKCLGDMYLKGKGTAKDLKGAFRAYQRAAQGNLNNIDFEKLFSKVEDEITQEMIYKESMRLLETSSFNHAIEELIKLADKGYTDAQFEVGKLYMNGYRVPKNINQAIRYLKSADKGGHNEAKKYLKELE